MIDPKKADKVIQYVLTSTPPGDPDPVRRGQEADLRLWRHPGDEDRRAHGSPSSAPDRAGRSPPPPSSRTVRRNRASSPNTPPGLKVDKESGMCAAIAPAFRCGPRSRPARRGRMRTRCCRAGCGTGGVVLQSRSSPRRRGARAMRPIRNIRKRQSGDDPRSDTWPRFRGDDRILEGEGRGACYAAAPAMKAGIQAFPLVSRRVWQRDDGEQSRMRTRRRPRAPADHGVMRRRPSATTEPSGRGSRVYPGSGPGPRRTARRGRGWRR